MFRGDPRYDDLTREHYEEMREEHEYRLPLQANEAGYESMQQAGGLLIIVARRDGEMIGYCIVVMWHHTHYNVLCGQEDACFVTRDARRSGEGLMSVGYQLIKRTVRELRRRCCVRCFFSTKRSPDLAALLQRIGMREMDVVYAMWL